MKSTINSRTIQSDSTFQELDVLQISINNYGSDPVKMIWNNTERILPAVDAQGVPTPFIISDNNNEFDLEIGFEFLTGTGNIIVDFSKKQRC